MAWKTRRKNFHGVENGGKGAGSWGISGGDFAGEGEAVEGEVEVLADGGEGDEAGVGAGDFAVAAEEEGGGDGVDGGGGAEGGGDEIVGAADGELGAEGGDFRGEEVVGAGIGNEADENEAAGGKVAEEGVPFGDGGAAGGIVGAEEEEELDLVLVLGGADGGGEFAGEVGQDEVVDGWGRGRGGVILAGAGGEEEEGGGEGGEGAEG